jgi:hypothetical protein
MRKPLRFFHYPCLLLAISLSFIKANGQFSAAGIQAGTVTTSSTSGGTDWTNPSNVQSADNVFATCLITGSNKPTYYLDAKNWGFQSGNNALATYIPSNAAINGIEVFIKLKKTNVGNMRDNKIILLKAGSEAGLSKARGATTWPATSTEIKFGGNIDLWGTTWTAADLFNTGFGIRISGKCKGSKDVQAEIDYVHINIYFNQVYYYSKSTGNLELTTSWGNVTDGSGTNPVNFTNNGQVFFLKNRTTATLTNNLAVTGTYSKLVVGDGVSATTLTVPSNYSLTGSVDLATLSNLTISNTTVPAIGAVSDNTTITYNAAGDQAVGEATYYNLSLSGSGTKTMNSTTGSIMINNVLSIASGITVDNQGNNILVYGVSTGISNNGTAMGTGRYTYAVQDASTNITGTGSYSNLEIDFSTTASARTLTLSNATSITGILYLTDGTLANGSNLTMSNGSTIELTDGILGSSITSSDYSVIYDPYSTASPKTTANELTGSLRNLTVQTGSGLTINLNRNLALSGNLVLATGTLDPTATNYNISIAGNYTNNASLTNRNNITTFNGAALQTVDASSAQSFYDLVINNTSGGLQINAPVTVNHALTLTNGIVTTGSTNILTMADGSTISGGNTSSYINGPIKHLLAAITGTKFFPIGKSGAYRPVSLSLTQVSSSSTSYTGEVFTGAPPSRTLPSTLSQVSSVRYYTVSSSNNANLSSATIVMNYGLDDNVTDPANLRIAKSSGSNWLNLGGAGSGSGSGNITSGSFTSFSDFVLATNNNIILPLKWISFIVTMKNNMAELKWQTAEETNTDHFNIEKSADGLSWEKIGIVNSNNNSVNTYLFTDNPIASKTYYRIKSIDRDGRASYSRVVSFSMNMTGTIAMTGNPVKPGIVEVSVSNTALLQKEKVQVKIFDMSGYLVFSKQAKPATSMQFDGSRLRQGNYILIIQADELFQKTRFIVQ